MESLTSISSFFLLLVFHQAFAASSDYWVSLVSSSSGKPELSYRKTENGDRIMDFSAVGYKGRDAPLPTPPVKLTLKPSGGDDTQSLQQAIDELSQMELHSSGFRGTLKLAPGTFNLGSSTIYMTASGIVIDGSGTDPETGTTLNAHKLPGNILFKINGSSDAVGVGSGARIVRSVPSGSSEVFLDDVSAFKPGDRVQVIWPWTSEWINMMNMSLYWEALAGKHKKVAERTVVEAVSNENKLVVDVPIPFRIDLHYYNNSSFFPTVQRIEYPVLGRISNVGMQNFRAVKDIAEPNDSGCFLKMDKIEDAWLANLALFEFGGTLGNHPPELWHATIFVAGLRITIANLELTRSRKAPKPGDKPFDIALEGPVAQQVLVKNTRVTGDNEYSFMSNSGVAGPNVFYNCTGIGANVAQPHAYFATGLLYDGVRIEKGGVEFVNRGAAGSGHGMAAGYSVAWRTASKWLRVLSPKEGKNWALGCQAELVNVGLNTDAGTPGVIDGCDPGIESLFLTQQKAAGM